MGRKRRINEELTVVEVAELLGVTRPTVIRWVKSGRLPGLSPATLFHWAKQQGREEERERIQWLIANLQEEVQAETVGSSDGSVESE